MDELIRCVLYHAQREMLIPVSNPYCYWNLPGHPRKQILVTTHKSRSVNSNSRKIARFIESEIEGIHSSGRVSEKIDASTIDRDFTRDFIDNLAYQFRWVGPGIPFRRIERIRCDKNKPLAGCQVTPGFN